MGPKVEKLANSAQILTLRPLVRLLIRPLTDQWGLLEEPNSPESLNKLVLPENVFKSAFYAVIPGKIGPKVAKPVNLTHILTFRPLTRPLKGPKLTNKVYDKTHNLQKASMN